MKNITKTAICLITILGILLSSSLAQAASDTSIFSIVGIQNTTQAILDYAVVPDTENGRTTTDAYYDLYLNPSLRIASVDTYLNGYLRIAFNFSISSIPAGFSYSLMQISFENLYNEDYFFTKIDSNYNSDLLLYGFFDNYWCWGSSASTLPLPLIHVRISIYSSSGATPPNYIGVACNTTVSSARYGLSAIPEDSTGFANIIKNAITEALSNSELDLVYDLLNYWKTTQDGYLADIELSVDDIELWLSYINSAQATLQNKVDLIYALEQTFPGYFGSIITLLQDIKHMNASDTAAESQMQNAEQQLSQAVNAMEVQKPNINNVVNAGDQYMDSNITGAQGDTFFWLHGTNIFVTILTMAVTIGILGFVIYGKSG